jgi:hypothetical protein
MLQKNHQMTDLVTQRVTRAHLNWPGSETGDGVDVAQDDLASVTAETWQKDEGFEDPLLARHPSCNIKEKGTLRGHVAKTPVDLFLAFFPQELCESQFDAWRAHAQQHNHTGLSKLNNAMFLRFVSLLVKMGLLSLRQRVATGAVLQEEANPPLSQGTFESLLRHGFQAYQAGELLPDGRQASACDPLMQIRKYSDDLQAHWQDTYELGAIAVVDETMIGWTGQANIHITVLPNNPTARGVCLKTLADAHTRVVLALEFVEARSEQGIKRHAEEGRSTAVVLRLTQPWHTSRTRIIITNAWFGGVPTVVALLKRGLYGIVNVKTATKHICKALLWEDARPGDTHAARKER